MEPLSNLIANDWRRLARFYVEVFGCILLSPERNLSGPDLEAGTGVASAAIQGAHLRLPGCDDDGPTLEIFQYTENLPSVSSAVNRPGFGHIAFAVDDVISARQEVLAAGGATC